MKWRLAVAGSPIAHSLSPVLHEAGLHIAGLDGSSQRLELAHDDAPRLMAMMGERFDAVSVTMPLKGLLGEYCDELDQVSSRTGSVNSLLIRDGRIFGASTDGIGFLDALTAATGFDPVGSHVVVFGAGGAARAIVDALVGAGSATLAVHGRTASNVAALTSRYEGVSDYAANDHPLDLVVNTVPIDGRSAQPGVIRGVDAATVAVDIVYEPRLSGWLAEHERAGCRTLNGLPMLAYQAARQMSWWWNVDIDGAQLLKVVQ